MERPLKQQHILVTRPLDQARPMVTRLEQLGATVTCLPVLSIRPPSDWTEVDRAIDELNRGEWDWLVFTSIHGVKHFVERFIARNGDSDLLQSMKLAAIGPSTAAALNVLLARRASEGRPVSDLPPSLARRANEIMVTVPDSDYSSEGLLATLQPLVAGRRVLLARANRGRDLMPLELAKIATVKEVVVYEQVDEVDASAPAFDALRRGKIGFVTLTSGNIARNFLAACDGAIRERIRSGTIRLVAISAATGDVIQSLGFTATVAEKATGDGVVEQIVRLASGGPSSN